MTLFRIEGRAFFSKLRRAMRALLLLIATVAIQRAYAATLPSFNLDSSTWEATHIVLVETTAQDGRFKVIESWKGDLKPGEIITISKMRPDYGAVPISSYPTGSEFVFNDTSRTTQIPKQPVGSRLVLFLKSVNSPYSSSGSGPQSDGGKWEPSNRFHDMKTAVVWMDGGKLYCFTQIINPGPSVLTLMHQWKKGHWLQEVTAAELKQRVDDVIQTQKELALVIQIQDAGIRARELKAYTRSDIFDVQYIAFSELGKAGPPALPVLRAMLDDPAYSSVRGETMHAYVVAGGSGIGEELQTLLQRELAFWKATGPKLGKNWWNEDATPEAPLRQRYSETLEIIRGLQTSRTLSALNTAIELRDFWRSLPQLNDPSGINRLAEECDELIQKLQPRE